MARTKRQRGAQPGNENARKHGFYSHVMNEANRVEMQYASEVEGIDEEITLLRLKIRELLERDPNNIELLLSATNTLSRLVKTRYNLTPQETKGIQDSIKTVLTDLAIPLGIGIGVGKL